MVRVAEGFGIKRYDVVVNDFVIVGSKADPAGIYSKLVVDEVRYTTLERAVEGLTSGIPTTLSEFEGKIKMKLGL